MAWNPNRRRYDLVTLIAQLNIGIQEGIRSGLNLRYVIYKRPTFPSLLQKLKLTFDDLLHHTPEWRDNATRARVRDAKLDQTEIESDVFNENKKGYANRAMTSSASIEDNASVTSKL